MSGNTERLNTALAGRYQIEKQLGQGGMATVYLAQDLKHDRKVAVKVLKPELAAVLGAERFVVEIKTTAALQHPHILPLFDSGTADSFLYYVMPYIEGETLRDRLNRDSQLGIDEAIKITTDVADALDYAHRHGVIHRDIKPENILLHDGRPMVADFGIALAVSAAAGGRMTETGLSLGTPHYMSPEQATADKDISARSDIYSLASVLYEMLAGVPPHSGGSAQQIIMRIITDVAEPVTKHRKSAPPHVADALGRALEKLPADRFSTAAEFASALRSPGLAMASSWATAARLPATSRKTTGRELVSWLAAAAMAITALSLWMRRPKSVESPVVRVPIDLPGDRLYPSTQSTIAISPKGDAVVFLAQSASLPQLMLRRTAETAARELIAGVVSQPAFSPDGRWLAYAEGGNINKVSVDGGASIQLAQVANATTRGLVWYGSDSLVIATDRGLLIVSSKGGTPRTVAGQDSTTAAWAPALLPDGETLGYTIGAGIVQRKVALTSLKKRKTTTLELSAAMVLGVREDHLLYITSVGELYAVPLDLARHQVTGDPVQLENGIRLTPNGSPLAALSETGTLWFATGQVKSHLVRAVSGQVAEPLMDEPRAIRAPRFSPDGRKIAIGVAGPAGSDVWIWDMTSKTFQPLTTDGTSDFPEWSPDGKHVIYRSGRNAKVDIYWKPSDGSGNPERLFSPPVVVNEVLMSPDAKWLVYRTAPGPQNRDIYAVPLQGDDRKPIQLVAGPNYEAHPRLSPNGKWLAYESDEGGRFEIYVRPFPGAGARIQVSNQGGTEPLWARTGDAILYRIGGRIERADVSAGATFSVGQRRTVLPQDTYALDLTHQNWDIWPDGRGFLMVKAIVGDADRPILVHNWGRTLREKLRGSVR